MTPEQHQKLIDFLWEKAEQDGISGLSPEKINGDILGVSRDQLYTVIPSEAYGILALLNDIKEKSATTSISGLPPQECLFELIMGQLDAAQPHRQAIKNIWGDLTLHPATALTIGPYFMRHGDDILHQSGCLTNSWADFPKQAAFQLLLTATFTTWLNDRTLDQSETMAALDGYIKRFVALPF
jgi:hypothetical protein